VSEPTGRRSPRLVAAAVATALAAVLLTDLGVTVARSVAPAAPAVSAVPRQRVAPDTTQLRDPHPDASIQALLDRRAAAVLHHDRAGFLATVDPESLRFRAAQGQLFDALAQVPLSSWSYQLDQGAPHTLPPGIAASYGAPAYAPAGVYLHYQLKGYDAQPTAALQFLTFVQRPTGWYLASDTDLDSQGLTTTRELWDGGPVVVAHGKHALVLGHPGSQSLMAALVAEADGDTPTVTQVWGSDWPQRVVVLVPSTQQELTQMVGGGEDMSQIAAVATAELPGRAGPSGAVGDLIIVNPANFAKLGSLGRRVVMTHEITHVATRAETGTSTPDWLVEGFADYVGYHGTGDAVGDAARELKAEVVAGHLPQRLPTDADFAGANARLPQVYEEAWLACRLVAEHGDATLVALYRKVGTASGVSSQVALERGLRDVLHTTTAAFTAQWRAYVAQQLS
jgi:hypothetical protein